MTDAERYRLVTSAPDPIPTHPLFEACGWYVRLALWRLAFPPKTSGARR